MLGRAGAGDEVHPEAERGGHREVELPDVAAHDRLLGLEALLVEDLSQRLEVVPAPQVHRAAQAAHAEGLGHPRPAARPALVGDLGGLGDDEFARVAPDHEVLAAGRVELADLGRDMLGLAVRHDVDRLAGAEHRLDDPARVVPEHDVALGVVRGVKALQDVGAGLAAVDARLGEQELPHRGRHDVRVGVGRRDDAPLVLPAVVIGVGEDSLHHVVEACRALGAHVLGEAFAEAPEEGRGLVVDAGEGAVEVEEDALGAHRRAAM